MEINKHGGEYEKGDLSSGISAVAKNSSNDAWDPTVLQEKKRKALSYLK